MKTRKILKMWKMMRKTSYWPSWKLKWIALFLISDALLAHPSKEILYLHQQGNTTRFSLERERERDLLIKDLSGTVAVLPTILNIMLLFCFK